MSIPSRIRPATLHDVQTLVMLMGEFYREGGYDLPVDAARRTFGHLLASPPLGGVWLMEQDGEPAGHVVLTVAFSMEYGGLRGFIDDLFVRPRFRRRGLAAEALAAVVQACRERGVRALFVETSLGNQPAVGAYQGIGLTDTRRMLMALPLEAPVHES